MDAQEAQSFEGLADKINENTGTQNDQTQNTTTEDNGQTTAETSKPAGYFPVDLSDLPEDKAKQIEERFKYFYGQVKGNERTLKEYRHVAQSQSQKIEELMNGMGLVVDHLQNDKLAETETAIRSQLRSAIETGDVDAQVTALSKLQEVTVKKQTLTQRPKNETQQQAYAGNSMGQIANDAMNEGEIGSDELRVVNAWQDEKDQSGRPLRPWAFRGDPQFDAGVTEAAAVFNNPRFQHLTPQQKLEEVDRRMGVKKPTAGQNVMGGGLQNKTKSAKITLSPKQEQIALKTKFAGPKASDAEHLKAYRDQIEMSNKRSAR